MLTPEGLTEDMQAAIERPGAPCVVCKAPNDEVGLCRDPYCLAYVPAPWPVAPRGSLFQRWRMRRRARRVVADLTSREGTARRLLANTLSRVALLVLLGTGACSTDPCAGRSTTPERLADGSWSIECIPPVLSVACAIIWLGAAAGLWKP